MKGRAVGDAEEGEAGLRVPPCADPPPHRHRLALRRPPGEDLADGKGVVFRPRPRIQKKRPPEGGLSGDEPNPREGRNGSRGTVSFFLQASVVCRGHPKML